jgi:hypothetical protein
MEEKRVAVEHVEIEVIADSELQVCMWMCMAQMF